MKAGSIMVCVSLFLMNFQFPIDTLSNTDGPTFPLEVIADKHSYSIGETVNLTLVNVGDETIVFLFFTRTLIADSSGNVIVDDRFCLITPNIIVGIPPGNHTTHYWDQKYRICDISGQEVSPTGDPVPPGKYNISLGSDNATYANVTMPIWDSVWIEILPEDERPVANAGPDQTAYEGDIVQFNGTGSRGSPSNRTIITEDGSEDNGPNPWKPRAASSPDGTLYIVWLGPADADEFHRRIFLSERDPEGSWEAPVKVTSWPKYENAPSIAVGSLGEIHIAFESFVPESDLGDIYVVSSFDSGRTFRNPVRVDDAPSGMASYYPEIEVASDGTLYVAWYDTRNGGHDVYVASSRDAGRSFSEDCIVNDITGAHFPPGMRRSGDMHPTLGTGPAGTLYVAWPSGITWSGIWADRSTDYGDSWNTDLRIDNSTASGHGPERPSLIVDSNSSIHVFWADYRLGHIEPGIFIFKPEIYYAHSIDDGVSYAPNQKANPEEWRKDRAAGPPSSTSDSEGTLFVAYPFLEGWYNHSVRAIVSTDHGSSFQLIALLDTRVRPDEWLARDIVEAYSWRSGCFGMVWLLEHLEPGVKVVVWDSCLSASGQNAITSYEWDFDASIDSDGDGNYTNDKEATGPTPTHIYYDDGIYVATLTITDSQGLQDTDQCNISVLNVPPTPEWTSRSSDGTILNPPYPEGKEILFTATVHDPGIYDTFTYDWDLGDGTILQDAGSSVVHTYGDDDAYVVVLTVTDDDGGVGVDDTPPLPTTNEKPVPEIILPFCIFVEGLSPCDAIGEFTDPGWLDTHSATWDFGDGTSEPAVLVEEHDSPDSTGWNISSHLYGDDGVYTISFTVTDDDGGTGSVTADVPVQNHPPSFDLWVSTTVNEGQPFVLGVEATDPGSDDLTIGVDWGDGTSDSQVYYNDGIGPDPPSSGAGVFPFVVQTNFTHVYPDSGDYDVTVTVEDDDGGVDTKVFQMPVLNVAPTVTLDVLLIEVNASLRIAGEKWHDVTIEMYEDVGLIAAGTLIRYPGSPDDQRLDLSQLQVDHSKRFSAIIRYTPEDDPINGQPNGATTCWIILNFSNGEELWIHQTFNVQHPETHVWEIDLTAAILMYGLTFQATAFDPGADDITFNWDFGNGMNVTTFYPNINETYPVEIMEIINHVFLGSGTYTVTVTVEDDDGGVGTASLTIVIP